GFGITILPRGAACYHAGRIGSVVGDAAAAAFRVRLALLALEAPFARGRRRPGGAPAFRPPRRAPGELLQARPGGLALLGLGPELAGVDEEDAASRQPAARERRQPRFHRVGK